jgi:hypothetical protein
MRAAEVVASARSLTEHGYEYRLNGQRVKDTAKVMNVDDHAVPC